MRGFSFSFMTSVMKEKYIKGSPNISVRLLVDPNLVRTLLVTIILILIMVCTIRCALIRLFTVTSAVQTANLTCTPC